MGYIPANYIDNLLDDLRTNGRKVLAAAEAAAAKAGVQAKTVLVETKGGSIADAILGQARKLKSSVIVMRHIERKVSVPGFIGKQVEVPAGH